RSDGKTVPWLDARSSSSTGSGPCARIRLALLASPNVAILDVRLPRRHRRRGQPRDLLELSRKRAPHAHLLRRRRCVDRLRHGEPIRRAAAGQSLFDPALTVRVLDRRREGPTMLLAGKAFAVRRRKHSDQEARTRSQRHLPGPRNWKMATEG